ncbi:MAG: CDP-glucose 4,6-dehydratase [Ignavibacteria bacterium]|nr:CDP-glucose 4,6-dehydratase [Ignavibacteria bacterium]
MGRKSTLESMGIKEQFGIYKGRRVLITGATGFKGSWLTYILKKLDADAAGFGLQPDTTPNLNGILKLTDKKKIVERDILEPGFIDAFINDTNPEIIFHLASQPLVSVSYQEPAETFRTNIFGLINLLESVRKKNQVKKIIIITSDKCYSTETGKKVFTEEDSLGGLDPYSASKGCAEIVSKSYYNSFLKDKGVSVVTARAGNIIGGGDWSKDRLIPDIIRAITEKRKIILRNPNSIRPWQHVFDALCGYLTVGAKMLRNELEGFTSYNFGPSESNEFRVIDIAEKFAGEFGISKSVIETTNPDFYETEFLRLDSNKVYEDTGWRSVWSTKESIEKTAEWYGEYYKNNTNASEICEKQITQYFSALNF